MITNTGRLNIRRFFAGELAQIAGSIAFGVGNTAASLADRAMQYEVVRVPVVSTSAPEASSVITVKATLPPGTIKTIYEIGIYASPAAEDPSRVLSVIDPGTAEWVGGTLDAANGRANEMTVRVDVAASGTGNATLAIQEDLSEYADADDIIVGYYSAANLSSVRFRLGTDASNYYEFVIAAPGTGYQTRRVNKSTATVTGTPDWADLTYFAVRPAATAGGALAFYFDGMRVERDESGDSMLVARVVPATPITLDLDVDSEIEYAMEVTFV